MDSPLFILDDPLNDPFTDAIAVSSDVDDPVLEVLRLDGSARGAHGSATAFFSTNGTRSYSLLLLLLLLFVFVKVS